MLKTTLLVLIICINAVQAFSQISFTQKEDLYLKNKKEITMCVDPDLMPFEKMENGKHIGIVADFFKIIRKKIGIPIKIIKTSSWEETFESAKSRKCDIISLAMKTPDRKAYFNFTTPYIKSSLVLVTKPNVTFIDNLEQITDKKIGIVKGYATNEILHKKYPDLTIVTSNNMKEGLQKVVNGEIFGFIENISTVGYLYETKFMSELKIAGKIDQTLNLSIAVRNDDLTLLNILNTAINSISTKTKRNILNNYLSIKYEKAFDYTLFWEIFGFIAFLSIIVLLRYRTITKYNKKIKKYLHTINENILISTSDKEGNILEVSEALCKLSGYTKEELIGKNHNIFRHKDMPKKLYKDMWDTIKSGVNWRGELKNLNKDGSYYWADMKISLDYTDKKELKGYIAIRQNITDKKELEKLSITDTLTQIPNRLFLDKNYDIEIDRAKRYKSKLSIILIDIDLFKNINDTYGHKAGDVSLVQIAQILKNNIRNTDILGRWGGEEFLIICPHTDIKQAKIVAKKIKDKIEKFDFSIVHTLTCSFGVSQYIESDKVNDIFIRADKALYNAKDNGRNRIEIS